MQVGHACLEAGRRFGWPPEPAHLVVLAVPSQAALQAGVERLRLAGLRAAAFWEPAGGLGLTAACTEVVAGPARRLFRRYPLWQAPNACATPDGGPGAARGPPALTRRSVSGADVQSAQAASARRR